MLKSQNKVRSFLVNWQIGANVNLQTGAAVGIVASPLSNHRTEGGCYVHA